MHGEWGVWKRPSEPCGGSNFGKIQGAIAAGVLRNLPPQPPEYARQHAAAFGTRGGTASGRYAHGAAGFARTPFARAAPPRFCLGGGRLAPRAAPGALWAAAGRPE